MHVVHCRRLQQLKWTSFMLTVLNTAWGLAVTHPNGASCLMLGLALATVGTASRH